MLANVKTQRAVEQIKARSVKAVVKDQPLVRERRDRLISAAVEVFKQKGFHATTVRDIGRKAGMTQGTIYNYVQSKDDVLYLVCDRLVAEYQDETRKALETTDAPLEQVRSAARAVSEVIYKHQEEILLIYQNTHLLDKRSLRVILARVDGFVRTFQKLIDDAARQANVRIDNSYLAANIFTFLPTMIALRRWAISGTLSKEEVLHGITNFLTSGLGFGTSQRVRSARKTRR